VFRALCAAFAIGTQLGEFFFVWCFIFWAVGSQHHLSLSYALSYAVRVSPATSTSHFCHPTNKQHPTYNNRQHGCRSKLFSFLSCALRCECLNKNKTRIKRRRSQLEMMISRELWLGENGEMGKNISRQIAHASPSISFAGFERLFPYPVFHIPAPWPCPPPPSPRRD